MKKTALLTVGLLASLMTVQAQYFTNGNLAVVRIGGTVNPKTTGDGSTVWIDQYTTGGTLVNSFAVPASGSNALILSGEPYEGYLSLTPDKTKLVFAGYNTPAPYASELIFSAATNVPRVIATLDGYGNYALPISSTNLFTGYTITSAVSDGTNYWAGGTGPSYVGSVFYLGTAAAPADNEVVQGIFGTGMRSVNLYNNALYAVGYTSNSAAQSTIYSGGAYILSNISGSLPTTDTGASNEIPSGTYAESTPSDLVINPEGTIAYIADDYQGGIIKFTNSGSGWSQLYIIPLSTAAYAGASSMNAISVTADFTQNPVVLYATTGESYTNRLVTLQDTGDATSANATLVNLAFGSIVAGTSTNTFRGVRFVPGAVPMITSQPESVTNDAGQTVSFSVSAIGSPPFSYQWYSNGLAIASATLSTLTLANTDTNYTGSEYRCYCCKRFRQRSKQQCLGDHQPSRAANFCSSDTSQPNGQRRLFGSFQRNFCRWNKFGDVWMDPEWHSVDGWRVRRKHH